MEIVNLRTLKAVVDTGGIKGASQLLNTVPSNITVRIQKLEDELNVPLFQLLGRKLQLTAAGHILYDYSVKMLNLEYQATQAVQRDKGSYELRIGAPETFTAVHLPMALKAFKRAHPLIRPKVITATSAELAVAVVNNHVDCATVGNADSHPDLHRRPLFKEQLMLVTPLDGQYEALLFVREKGCGYRKWALAWQQANGRSNEGYMVMSSADGILGCVSAGLGYTVISRDMVVGSRYEKALSMRALKQGPRHLSISMLYRKDSILKEGIEALTRLLSKA